MALAKALWLCLLPGISLVGTGSVHASNWLLKGPGCLCALQQAGGNFFPPEGLEGGRSRPSSPQHSSQERNKHPALLCVVRKFKSSSCLNLPGLDCDASFNCRITRHLLHHATHQTALCKLQLHSAELLPSCLFKRAGCEAC